MFAGGGGGVGVLMVMDFPLPLLPSSICLLFCRNIFSFFLARDDSASLHPPQSTGDVDAARPRSSSISSCACMTYCWRWNCTAGRYYHHSTRSSGRNSFARLLNMCFATSKQEYGRRSTHSPCTDT